MASFLPRLDKPEFQTSFPSDEAIRDRSNVLTDEQATLIRELHAIFIRGLPRYPSRAFKGRGIVMLAGGRYTEYAATTLGVLRDSGSRLPVEVWSLDEREEKVDWCDEIRGEGMACRRLADYVENDVLLIEDPKAVKAFTMLFSSFEEMIFLDADNMALSKPEVLFESAGYHETGTILWHDYWKYDNLDWLDYIIGVSDGRSEDLWTQKTYESGQIVWNKKRHWESLLLATMYNWYGPRLYYTLLNSNFAGYGDKDTFALALRALGKPFYTVPYEPGWAWMSERVGHDGGLIGMPQMAPPMGEGLVKSTPEAMFLHSTTLKFSHRELLCESCAPIWSGDSTLFVSAYEDDTKEVYRRLHNNIRIIDEGIQQYLPNGCDVEVRIWRAMEYAACRSKAWRHPRACKNARRYMMETFGFRFSSAGTWGSPSYPSGGEGDGWIPRMNEDVCLLDPETQDRLDSLRSAQSK